MAFNYSPKIITDSLVLYLDAANTRSYPTTGSVWSDLSRNNNNGTLINGPTFNSSNGGSIVFDGVNDFVNCDNTNSLNIIQSITVESWVYMTSLSNSNDICIVGKYSNSGGSSNQAWLLFKSTSNLQSLGPNNSGPANNEFGWVATSNGGLNGAFIGTGEQVLTNVWYQVVGVFNSSINTNQIYINGVLKRSVVRTNQTFGVLATGIRDISIGSTPADNSRRLQGRVNNTKIYNRALSAQEVLQNYNATKGRFGLT